MEITIRSKFVGGIVFGFFIIVGSIVLFTSPPLAIGIVQCSACPEQPLALAAQLGPHDIVSMALALTALAVGSFAIFGFFALSEDAKQAAKKEALDALSADFEKRVGRIAGQIIKDTFSAAARADPVRPPPHKYRVDEVNVTNDMTGDFKST